MRRSANLSLDRLHILVLSNPGPSRRLAFLALSRRCPDQVIFGPLGVLRLRRVPLGARPCT